jgi:hypothetical protein
VFLRTSNNEPLPRAKIRKLAVSTGTCTTGNPRQQYDIEEKDA